VEAEFNAKPHVRGTLSMARSSDPNSAGSQFFICHARAASLDNKYTVFGQLVYGYKVLDTIITAPAIPNRGGENSLPVKPVVVNNAEVTTWGEYKKSLESGEKTEVVEEKKEESN
jgi:peptidyl-prolyl cis-trans isomerase B (cyclophilin B)